MECQCDRDGSQDAATGWWMGGNSVQMGAFTVVGYLLYRFSQTLPALIRWPIRLFCSLTGLTALWSWVGRVVGTLRGIQSLCKWLSRVWRFFVAIASKFKWVNTVIKAITGSSGDESVDFQTDPSSSVRLILLGLTGAGRTSLADTLLGNKDTGAQRDLMDTAVRRNVVGGTDLTVIDTPDILTTSLKISRRAKEALRSLQLTSPGPHALFLVIPALSSGQAIDLDAVKLITAAVDLYGEGVLEFIIPVVTHADQLGPSHSVDELLAVDAGGLRRAVSLCGQKPELVDNRPDMPLVDQRVTRRRLIERVKELREIKGHFVHELQRKEDEMKEELLADMSAALAKKLGHK